MKKFYHKLNQYQISYKGKLVVVTGGTSGIGRVTVKDLYLQGATVVFLGRRDNLVKEEIIPDLISALKSQKTHKFLTEQEAALDIVDLRKGLFSSDGSFTSKRLHYRKVDLTNLDQVQSFTDYVRDLGRSITLLINNAGAQFTHFEQGAQHIEKTMGVNVIAAMLITDKLLDLLENNSRVVNVASLVNMIYRSNSSELEFNGYFNPTKENYWNWAQYFRSKLGVVLWTKGLQAKFDEMGVKSKAVSLHPGAICSDFMRNLPTWLLTLYKMFWVFPWAMMKSNYEGAQTTLYCSQLPYDQLVGGEFYSDCRLEGINKLVTTSNTKRFMQEAGAILEKKGMRRFKYLNFF